MSSLEAAQRVILSEVQDRVGRDSVGFLINDEAALAEVATIALSRILQGESKYSALPAAIKAVAESRQAA